jgi:hypothetical protein
MAKRGDLLKPKTILYKDIIVFSPELIDANNQVMSIPEPTATTLTKDLLCFPALSKYFNENKILDNPQPKLSATDWVIKQLQKKYLLLVDICKNYQSVIDYFDKFDPELKPDIHEFSNSIHTII